MLLMASCNFPCLSSTTAYMPRQCSWECLWYSSPQSIETGMQGFYWGVLPGSMLVRKGRKWDGKRKKLNWYAVAEKASANSMGSSGVGWLSRIVLQVNNRIVSVGRAGPVTGCDLKQSHEGALTFLERDSTTNTLRMRHKCSVLGRDWAVLPL